MEFIQYQRDVIFSWGDNRNNSNDSRFWQEKYVPQENIVAKSRCIIHLSDLIGDN